MEEKYRINAEEFDNHLLGMKDASKKSENYYLIASEKNKARRWVRFYGSWNENSRSDYVIMVESDTFSHIKPFEPEV